MHSKSHLSSMRYLTFLLAALIWGTTWTAIKLSLEGYPPVIGATLRFVLAIAMLGLYARVTRLSLVLPRHTIVWVAATAILVYVVDYGLVYRGEQYLSAGVTAILFAAVPLATMLGSVFAFRTGTFRHREVVGILFGFLGIFVVFFDPLVATGFSAKATLAAVAVVVAAMAAAFNIVIAKRHLMHVGRYPADFSPDVMRNAGSRNHFRDHRRMAPHPLLTRCNPGRAVSWTCGFRRGICHVLLVIKDNARHHALDDLLRHTVGGGVQRPDSTQRIDQLSSRKWRGGDLCGTGDYGV
jgi:hypothetical protein